MMSRLLFFIATIFIFSPNVFAEIDLNQLGTYQTGVFDEGAAEIAAFDPELRRVFFVNGDEKSIDVIDIANPSSPFFLFRIDVSEVNGTDTAPNSVDVKNGIVAVAVENDEDGTENGYVIFFENSLGDPIDFLNDVDASEVTVKFEGGINSYNYVEVGVLPDALKFSPDGSKIIVSNEGEALANEAGDDVIYPEGSMSLILIPENFDTEPTEPIVMFTSIADAGFDDRKEDLKSRGIKLQDIGDINPSQDMEPELAAFSPDGNTAIVTFQEANAIGVLDTSLEEFGEMANGVDNRAIYALPFEFLDVLPLGLKDHSRGQPELMEQPVSFLQTLGSANGQTIKLGGFSGLAFEGTGRRRRSQINYVTIPDRGPNGETFREESLGCGEGLPACRPFLIPDYQARIEFIVANSTRGTSSINTRNRIFLTRKDGVTPITGISNIEGIDERPVDGNDNPLEYDPYGGDFESITIAPDDSYWMVDEYRPSIYNFDDDGVLIERYVPEGTAAQVSEAVGTFGAETLPSVYKTRRANRGFEAGALDTDNDIFYAFIQTPLANPDREASDTSKVIRILGIDPSDGTPVAEYVYFLEDPDVRPGGRVDKIGDAVYAGDNKFYVIERDSTLNDPKGKKFIFMIDLTGATNIIDNPVARREAGDGTTLEQMTVDEIVIDESIKPVHKMKVLNLPSIGYIPSDKPEGIALLPDGRLAVLNDNDFGLGDDPSAIPVLATIDLNENNKLDPSNEDNGINIANHPVFGMYQPDTITSCEINGMPFYLTANEGDAREVENDDEDIVFVEEIRIKDLDITGFPPGTQLEEELGRLKVTTLLGNLDGDGELIDSGLDQGQPQENGSAPTYEKLVSFGTRSFSIWDEFGNLVYDSGDDFETITAAQIPSNFNSDNDENSFDSRSDDKGPEPEAIACGQVNGDTYAFIGLERVGGIMVYNISDPSDPDFVQYLNNRNFGTNIESPAAGDLGPESIVFVSAADSPIANPIIIVANEVSGTVTMYEIIP